MSRRIWYSMGELLHGEMFDMGLLGSRPGTEDFVGDLGTLSMRAFLHESGVWASEPPFVYLFSVS